MKKFLALAALAAVSAAPSYADTLADWTFETSAFTSVTNTGTAPLNTSIAPEVGAGSATGLHASSSTFWQTPTGNGSTKSLSSDHWTQGDYYQFSTTLDQANSTYSGFSLSYSQNGSGTGPKTYGLSYSLDGSTFTQFGSDYTLTASITWNSTTAQGTQESFDLGSITALNTANTVYFRVFDDSPATGGAISGGNVGTGGTGRIEDFTISATVVPIPEPSSLAIGIVGGLAALTVWKRKK